MFEILTLGLLAFGAAAPKPVKAPEMDLAYAATAVTLLAGGIVWMRYRRKR